jgi:hypothetical protein
MGRAGRVGPNASHRWSARSRRLRPVVPIWTRADWLRRPTGDVLSAPDNGDFLQSSYNDVMVKLLLSLDVDSGCSMV